jgi:hypothetical protein
MLRKCTYTNKLQIFKEDYYCLLRIWHLAIYRVSTDTDTKMMKYVNLIGTGNIQ